MPEKPRQSKGRVPEPPSSYQFNIRIRSMIDALMSFMRAGLLRRGDGKHAASLAASSRSSFAAEV